MTAPEASPPSRSSAPTSSSVPPPGPEGPVSPLAALQRFGWQAVLVAGVVAVVLGVVVLAWPGRTLLIVGVIFGVYLVASGILQLVAAAAVPGHSGLKVLAFVSGALSILLGLFCFRGRLESLLLLGLWIGIGWLFRGIAGAMAAADTPTGSPGRGWGIFLGVVTAVAGIVLITDPFGSLAALTLMAGVWLLVIGFVEIGHAVSLRSRAREAHGA